MNKQTGILGKHVAYIREISEDKQKELGIDAPVLRGGARVKGFFIDQDNRVMVHLVDDNLQDDGTENIFTTALSCLDPSEEFCKEFELLVRTIDETAAKARTKQQAFIEEVNNQINEMKDKLLGEPVDF